MVVEQGVAAGQDKPFCKPLTTHGEIVELTLVPEHCLAIAAHTLHAERWYVRDHLAHVRQLG